LHREPTDLEARRAIERAEAHDDPMVRSLARSTSNGEPPDKDEG